MHGFPVTFLLTVPFLILNCSASNEQPNVPVDKKPPDIISSSSSSSSSRCQEITIPMCKTIRYNYTEMPNSFNHETQEEAGLEVHQYWPLVEIKCSDDLKFFICSLYVPICMEDYAGTVPPCRSVCERARAGCEPVMTQYGFFWPERMVCDQFPKFGKNSICMDEKGGELPGSGGGSGSSGGGGGGGRTLIAGNGNIVVLGGQQNKNHHYQGGGGNDVIIKPVGGGGAGRNGNDESCGGHHQQCKCEYPMVQLGQLTTTINSSSSTTGDHAHQPYSLPATCAFPCRGYGYSSPEEIRFANYWLTFWSSFTCSVSTLTILTYLIDSTRFNYPERPIICISLCYVFVSIGYLIRIYVGHSEIACGGAESPVVRYPGSMVFPQQPYHQSPSSPVCTLVFLLTYYFTIAGSCWYVVLTITWYLASVLKWGTEAISEKSGLFHSVVWVSSAVISLVVLLSDSIDGDSISGICFVGNQDYRNLVVFVLVPMGGLLVLGGVFLVSGFVALVKIRSVIAREVRNFHKLEKLMIRIGVFGVLYTVNVVCVLTGYLYEAWVRDQWVQAVNCGCINSSSLRASGSNGAATYKPAYSVLMIKYFMTLATGITSSIWVFSSKTVDTWKRFLLRILTCGRGAPRTSSSGGGGSSSSSIMNNQQHQQHQHHHHHHQIVVGSSKQTHV